MLSIQTDEFLESIQKGDQPKFSKLLATNPELANSKTKSGVSAILQALYYGQSDIARAIAERKSDLDIFEASVLGELDRVKSLTKQDASILEKYSPDGFTALALAAYLGQKGVTEYLLAEGANVNAIAKNATGFTALTGAVANGNNEIARILVRHGANVNHRYEEGASPLMEASLNGNLELVNFLLDNGADISAKMKDGKSSLSFAKEKNHLQVVEALKRRGAL
jgi:ankyrin repeat protein